MWGSGDGFQESVVCCGSGCWVLGVVLGISLVQAALPLSHLNGSGMDIYLKLV